MEENVQSYKLKSQRFVMQWKDRWFVCFLLKWREWCDTFTLFFRLLCKQLELAGQEVAINSCVKQPSPQQTNGCDCGLFVLMNVQKYLQVR